MLATMEHNEQEIESLLMKNRMITSERCKRDYTYVICSCFKAMWPLCGNEFELYTGEDANTVEFILAGGVGTISVTANVAPAALHNMCVAALAGDGEKAHQINKDLVLLHENLFLEANPIPVKWALTQMDLIPQGIRLPMTVLSEQYHQPVRDALMTAGVLK